MAAPTEVHHAAPRCLLRLWDAAHGGDPHEITGETIEASLEWEHEAMRWSVPVEIAREDLERLIEASTVAIPVEEHRRLHSEASDFARWGRRGGLVTLGRYGTSWFALLALRRWERITPADLEAARVL